MAGESLEVADITETGILGDRIIQIRDSAGRIVTARTRPLLLRHRATFTSDQEVLVDGRPWQSAQAARDVEVAAGAGAYGWVRANQETVSTSFHCSSLPTECLMPWVMTADVSGPTSS